MLANSDIYLLFVIVVLCFANFMPVALTWNCCWYCRWRHASILALKLMWAVLAHYRLQCIVLHIIIFYHIVWSCSVISLPHL